MWIILFIEPRFNLFIVTSFFMADGPELNRTLQMVKVCSLHWKHATVFRSTTIMIIQNFSIWPSCIETRSSTTLKSWFIELSEYWVGKLSVRKTSEGFKTSVYTCQKWVVSVIMLSVTFYRAQFYLNIFSLSLHFTNWLQFINPVTQWLMILNTVKF